MEKLSKSRRGTKAQSQEGIGRIFQIASNPQSVIRNPKLLIFYISYLIFIVSLSNYAFAQQVKVLYQKPKISVLEKSMIEQGLVDVQSVEPNIMVELKYSTTDNFVKKDVYGDFNKAYLQKRTVFMLANAQKILQKKHSTYRLLVYDAARPVRVQKILWNMLSNMPEDERENYVSSPTKGSIHSYGCAVDLTIYDTKTKIPLDMGTKFDFFGDLAYPSKEQVLLKAKKLNLKQVENRRLLRSVMKKAAFMPIETEWWHFNAMTRALAKASYKMVE